MTPLVIGACVAWIFSTLAILALGRMSTLSDDPPEE